MTPANQVLLGLAGKLHLPTSLSPRNVIRPQWNCLESHLAENKTKGTADRDTLNVPRYSGEETLRWIERNEKDRWCCPKMASEKTQRVDGGHFLRHWALPVTFTNTIIQLHTWDVKLETRTHLALWKTHKISLASRPEDTLHSTLFLEAGCHWDFEWPIKKSQDCLERK